jgi:hypothetical protein
MDFPALNLPQAKLVLKKKGEIVFVYDPIRGKELVLTPEEWVRQHLVYFFKNHLKYPQTLFALETGLKYNKRNKRTDILIYDREGKVWMLIECKAATILINKAVLEQGLVYATYHQPKYLVLSNGINHQIIFFNNMLNKIEFLEDFPEF